MPSATWAMIETFTDAGQILPGPAGHVDAGTVQNRRSRLHAKRPDVPRRVKVPRSPDLYTMVKLQA